MKSTLKNIRWASAAAAIFAVVACSPETNEIDFTTLAATNWATLCGTTGKTVSKLQFTSETEVALVTETYKTVGCADLSYTTTYRYTYSLSDAEAGPIAQFSKTKRITLKVVSITITPNSDAGVTTLNTASMCGKTNWTKDTAVSLLKDLTLATTTAGSTCPAYNSMRVDATAQKMSIYTEGEEIFQIITGFALKESGTDTETRNLVLGALSLDGETGLTLETAPTTWNTGAAYVEVK